ELVRRNIPYVKYGGLKFLEASHVKDYLGILKWAENPKNQVAAFRVLKLMPGFGPANAARCCEHLGVRHHALETLAEFKPPTAAAAHWASFTHMLTTVGGQPVDDPDWQSQLTLVRGWYQPLLEQIYDSAPTRTADLDQLEQIARRFPTRERFLTELTLDPPSTAGDLAGEPLLDEDYLVLSTVHSAKGQEWDSVFLLSVTDGSFPSEFATGKPDMIEEERRLLYVAMTRARNRLHLIAPLRYHVTQQRRDGDRHVYGARSRFMSDALLGTMEPSFFGRQDTGDDSAIAGRKVDVRGKLLDMW
ncbi:MAG: ATP-dependent helicase, partial [Pseudomonadota bacterium]